jgi:predicted GNAT family N-acyltransferase
MYFIEIPFGSPQFDQAVNLRNRLLRIPLNMEFEADDIALEWKEYHLGFILTNFKLIACLTLKPVGEGTLKMRQVAVDEAFQRRGIGKELVGKTELWCLAHEVHTIVLNARETAVPFYKAMNYETIGDRFVEVVIPHYKMQKKIG